ncbi:Hsp70 family protein [Dactylosporangium sp. NBC_01737]|uniref:Hsp70 family protein n=1 Tax=Dactylosporangium sp. NBC_01737 TaxID=2975959 RepID=UPI002E0E62A9|nr:Hsp70 family protein [Dactylosporangium sp. NBC_01737]
MAAFGIDLGTTYSCISRVDGSTGEPVIIPNEAGEDTTPSVVYFESAYKVQVGADAKNVARTDPDHVVALIKRDMGRKNVQLNFHGLPYTPESVSALILKDLVKSVSRTTGETVESVVITVPAYFGVAERQATRVAGEIAGLDVINVIEEPVAAAMYYGLLTPGANRTILVYDLGGGTFDTTVIKLVDGDVTVVCTDGSHSLGGADWDEAVATYLFDYFVAEEPGAGAEDSEELLQDLMLVAEKLKMSLSVRQTAEQAISFRGRTVRAQLSRAAFEEMTADLLEQTLEITDRTLHTAREKGVDKIDEVLLVGGSTHMPIVFTRLAERVGVTPKRKEPDLAVAKGAALFAVHETARTRLTAADGNGRGRRAAVSAERLADELGVPVGTIEKMQGRKVTTVVPRAFGVIVLEDLPPEPGKPEPEEPAMHLVVEHLLHANTPLPTERVTKQFGTAVDNQREIRIEIWEQAGDVESRQPTDNTNIGEGLIKRLPPLKKGSPVDVTFQMTEGGKLFVEAKELHTGLTLNLELQIGEMTPGQVADARDAVSRLS